MRDIMVRASFFRRVIPRRDLQLTKYDIITDYNQARDGSRSHLIRTPLAPVVIGGEEKKISVMTIVL
jgi:hypothetical protein